jgi:hypothetical protein
MMIIRLAAIVINSSETDDGVVELSRNLQVKGSDTSLSN